MYKQCVLPLLALYVGLARSISWDIVVGQDSRIEFYNDGILQESVIPSYGLMVEWLFYDPIHKQLLIFDKKSASNSVLSFDLSTKKTETLIKKNNHGAISTIAYDPASRTFFGVINKIIYSFVLKPGNDIAENIVINLQKDESEPRDIVVDSSCGGYIYWTTFSTTNVIERVRFNGMEREIVIKSSDMTRIALTIGPQTKKLYWIEPQQDLNKFSIVSADLNGENLIKLCSLRGMRNFIPNQLSVSKNFIYGGNAIKRIFWQIPNNPLGEALVKPKKVKMDTTNFKFGFHGIATYYEVEEKVQGKPNCKALKSHISTDASFTCEHGTKVNGESRCVCTPGYSGEKCNVSACQNYCIQGDCIISSEGQPTCRCNPGYSGKKCEVLACQGHCLNSGICSLDKDSEPVCQCTSHYEGDRCNVPIFLNQCLESSKLNKDVKPVNLGKGDKSKSASKLPRMTVTWKNGPSLT